MHATSPSDWAVRRVSTLALFMLALLLGVVAGSAWHTADVDAASCSGGASRQYAWRQSTLQAYGVDGYLRHPTGSLSDPDCSFLAHFLSLTDPSSPVGSWVQVGLTIGVLPTPPGGVPTTYKIYSDGVNNCETYSLANHGNPSSSNAPYYVSYTGETGTSCSTTWYRYAVRKDSFGNQPIWYRLIDSADGVWVAQNEAYKRANVSAWPDTGEAWWGHQTSSTWPLGYGLAWYNYGAGTWNEWTSSQGGTTYYDPTIGSNEYRWCVDSVNRAQHSLKGASC